MDVSANQFGFAMALTAVVLTIFVPKITRATDGYYSTTSESTTTSSTDADGVTTSTTSTTNQTPRGIYSTGRDNDHTDRTYDERHGAESRDLDARYPYDNTHGTNRSDVDAVRTGFDDPRNPWDGRYMNDNPSSDANSTNNLGANGTVNAQQGDSGRYSPGRYGTYSVHTRRAGR
jgi:hypothetical protein